jgi:hypothetical protein
MRGGFFMGKLARLTALIMLVGVFAGGSAIAAPTDGASEVQVSAGLFHQQGSDSGNLNADLSYGYYLTPAWQLGFRQALNYNFIDDSRDVWVATTAPFINWHFRLTDIVIPYLGAFIGLAWNDRDATGTIGPQAGIKFFVHDTTFLNLGYRYEWFFSRFEAVEDNASRGNHVFNLGIGFTWGGAPSSKAKP